MDEIISVSVFVVLQTEMEQLRSYSHLNIDPVCFFLYRVTLQHTVLVYGTSGQVTKGELAFPGA